MTAVTPSSATPACSDITVIPPRIMTIIDQMTPTRYAGNGDDPGLVIQREVRWNDADQQAAAALLPAAEAAMQPANPRAILAWLLMLNEAVGNPLASEAFKVRAASVVQNLGDLPAPVWSVESRKAAVLSPVTGRFFPSVAELHGHLKPYADRLRQTLERLRRVAEAPQTEDAEMSAKPAMQAERDAVLARFRRDMSSVWGKPNGHAIDVEAER